MFTIQIPSAIFRGRSAGSMSQSPRHLAINEFLCSPWVVRPDEDLEHVPRQTPHSPGVDESLSLRLLAENVGHHVTALQVTGHRGITFPMINNHRLVYTRSKPLAEPGIFEPR